MDFGPTGGDEFAAVKPWLGAIVPPSAWVDGPKGAGPGTGTLTPSEKIVRAAAYFTAIRQLSTIHNKIRGSDSTSISSSNLKVGRNMYDEVRACCRQVASALSVSGINNSAAPEGDELELEFVQGK